MKYKFRNLNVKKIISIRKGSKRMNERKIEDYIISELPLDDQKIALDFVGYLHREKMVEIKKNEILKKLSGQAIMKEET